MSDRDRERRAEGNRLVHELSPYLQQHAHNPVDWYPWGEEAFEEARRRDVPIFLSIGYATCHWCHVMERESFEDPRTASLMNSLFVNVKVDREERPDVDSVYIQAAQALTGAGGWPLSVWLTPGDLHPFYAGTYYPPKSQYGRPGFVELLTALRQAWDNDRERVLASSRQITEAIEKSLEVDTTDIGPKTEPDPFASLVTSLATDALTRLTESFDLVDGGFGRAPKFPRPSVLFFLLTTGATVDDEYSPSPIDMVHSTLEALSRGGIHDHLGGGFARYSVDTEWRVPHFEKMLYDQAQLLEALARTFLKVGDQLLEQRIISTIAYLDRDMKGPEGGYYSAEDADSEGEEGTFYVWRIEEIREILDPEEADLYIRHYGLTGEGNFEEGKNVLHYTVPIEKLAEELDLPVSTIERRLASASALLFDERKKRERPLRDEKIITAWNGLLLSGFAWSARALDDPGFYARAESLAEWIEKNLKQEGALYRRRVGDDLRQSAFLEDHAFLLRGLIDLYDAGQDPKWLRRALDLATTTIDTFWSEENGFTMTDGADSSLPVASRSDHDGAEPSGSSAMAWSLARLGILLDIDRFREIAARTVVLHGERIASYPDVMPLLITAGEFLTAGSDTIVVLECEGDRQGYERLIEEARTVRGDRTDIILLPLTDRDPIFAEHLSYLEEMKPLEGASTVFRCVDFACGAPSASLEKAESNEQKSL